MRKVIQMSSEKLFFSKGKISPKEIGVEGTLCLAKKGECFQILFRLKLNLNQVKLWGRQFKLSSNL